MLLGILKKRVLVGLVFILLCSMAYAETAQKRVFQGSGQIQAGRYEDFLLRVVAAEKVIFVDPGETAHFNLYLRRGIVEGVVHNVEVIGNDDNFVLSFEPSVIPAISIIDMVSVKATLTARPDLPPGDYPLRLRIKGSEFVEESYPFDSTIRVGSTGHYWNSSFLAVAIGLIGLMVWRTMSNRKR